MAAARYSNDVLQQFYGRIPRNVNRNIPNPINPESVLRYDQFKVSQNNFQGWLNVWRMDMSPNNPKNRNIEEFEKNYKEKLKNIIVNNIVKYGSKKINLATNANFSKQKVTGKTENMSHFFQEKQPKVYTEVNEEKIKKDLNILFDKVKEEIIDWSKKGSG